MMGAFTRKSLVKVESKRKRKKNLGFNGLRVSYNIAFLAEVINKALTCKENSDISIFEIISEAAGKRMGLSVNAEQLKSNIMA